MNAGGEYATGFPFPNNQPGTLMIRNGGCETQRQVCKFHGLERAVRKSRPMDEKADVCSLLSSPHTYLSTHHSFIVVILVVAVVVVLIVFV
jgi:hypothetical protein